MHLGRDVFLRSAIRMARPTPGAVLFRPLLPRHIPHRDSSLAFLCLALGVLSFQLSVVRFFPNASRVGKPCFRGSLWLRGAQSAVSPACVVHLAPCFSLHPGPATPNMVVRAALHPPLVGRKVLALTLITLAPC